MKKFNLLHKKNPPLFNEKTISVFKSIFTSVATYTQILDKKSYKDYYTQATGYQAQYMDPNVEHNFDRYDKEKKGFWIFDEF